MVTQHNWHLVGPWYRWGSTEEDPRRERSSRPIIQKYADSNHVQMFLDNPQRSLKYLPEDLTDKNRRKIYLDTHSRFYLVTCALHCDTPGFPKVARDRVCEAGFVVRKRKTEIPEAIRPQVEKLLKTIAYERARLKRIQSKRNKYTSTVGAMAVARGLKSYVDRNGSRVEDKVTQRRIDAQLQLNKLVEKYGISPTVQGWRRIGPGAGTWEQLDDETPEQTGEQIYPLYPLIPDNNDTEHASGHKTIWYGLLPVGSADVDGAMNAQFDDHSVYEIRCFVRRHKPQCPKSNERNDCKGELVWSRPTETYQLAPHFDLVGTSNRLTTIQAPSLNDLMKQVNSPDFKLGQGMGMAVATPAGSSLPINLDGDNNPQGGAPSKLPSICFFAIPLITIVAFFVLRLFLPIVVFLFGLWFLLSLRLCILPTLSIDIGAEFDIELEGKLGIEVEAELEVKLEAGGPGGEAVTKLLPFFSEAMRDAFNAQLADIANHPDVYADMARIAVRQTTDLSGSGVTKELVDEINAIIADDPEIDAPFTSGSGRLSNPADRLEYYDKVSLEEVFA